MPFEFGDVVLVPFPFTNQTASKQRPAVVVSSQGYGLERPDLMLMAVIATREQSLVIRRLGALAAEDQDALRLAIGQIIG